MSKRPELTFHQEDMQMNNQHMRRCLMSPVIREMQFKTTVRDFPGGPVVKNLSCNAGDLGSVLGPGTQIPHATEQLSLHSTATEPTRHNSRAHALQQKIPSDATQKDSTGHN